MAAVVLALGAAALWGTGDFLGGLTTRRLNVLIVLFWSQLVGLAGARRLDRRERCGAARARRSLWAAGAGSRARSGSAASTAGMAIGAMGIVAPISATSPIVPLLVSVARGDSPGAVQWVGIALALAGVVLVSREPGGAGSRVAAGVGLALSAALGFGLFIVGLGEAAQESAPWATATARFSSVARARASRSRGRGRRPRVPRRLVLPVVAVGAFDTAPTSSSRSRRRMARSASSPS